MNKENKPETAAGITTAIETEETLPAIAAYQLCKRLEGVARTYVRKHKCVMSTGPVNDFLRYYIETIMKSKQSWFPMIFAVTNCGSNLYFPSLAGQRLFLHEGMRYYVAKHGYAGFTRIFERFIAINEPELYCVDFDVDDNPKIERITAKQADNICRDAYIPWFEKCKSLIGLPTDLKMKIEFNNLTLSKFKELLSDPTPLPQTYSWQETPKTVGESLMWCLKRIRSYDKLSHGHKYTFRYSEREKAFYFSEHREDGRHELCGAIIYHGSPKEGYDENYSVQLTPTYGWSTHT